MEGCLFHFCQALWRHLQEWGLVVMYKDTGATRLKWFVKRIMALAFLPPDRIEGMFHYLVQSKWPQGVPQQHPPLIGWLRYVQDTWIYNDYFPRHLWSVFYRVDNRTNNFIESKHNVFRDVFLVHGPLWTFCARMIVHHRTELETQHVHSYGRSPSTRDSAPVTREGQLAAIKGLYTSSQLNDYEYLKRVAYYLKDY